MANKIEQHITAKEMADRLAVHPSTVQQLIANPKLTAVKLGRKFCIPESASLACIASRIIKVRK